MSIRKVVIPLTISEISPEILPIVRRLFEPTATHLTLIAVARSPQWLITADSCVSAPPFFAPAWVDTPEEWESYRQGLAGQLEAIAERLRASDYRVNTALLTGNAVDEIPRFIEGRNFDLLAMATYARSGLDWLLHGCVAEQLLRRVSVPMLLFRPPTAVIQQNRGHRKRSPVSRLEWDDLATAATGATASATPVG